MAAQIAQEISDLTREQIDAIYEDAEYHNVPFGSMPVDAFGDDLIREAVAQYWQPEYSIEDGDGRIDSELYSILYNILPQGLEYRFNRMRNFDFLVEVKVVLTYPFTDYWEATVKIPANRFGEIFSVAHDMYRHVYDLDDAYWQAQGHQDSTPRVSSMVINRAKGKYVWGHDISDLVFENVGFLMNPNWGTSKRRVQRIIDCTDDNGLTSEEKLRAALDPNREPEYEDVPEPLDEVKHRDACPMLGTVVFGIGS